MYLYKGEEQTGTVQPYLYYNYVTNKLIEICM